MRARIFMCGIHVLPGLQCGIYVAHKIPGEGWNINVDAKSSSAGKTSEGLREDASCVANMGNTQLRKYDNHAALLRQAQAGSLAKGAMAVYALDEEGAVPYPNTIAVGSNGSMQAGGYIVGPLLPCNLPAPVPT